MIRLVYDSTGRLIEVFDSNDMPYFLSYLDDNRLESIIYPDTTMEDLSDNPRKTFLYEDSERSFLLTGIIDENNIRYSTWTYDDKRRVVSSEHNNVTERVELAYLQNDMSGRAFTRVTNALGKQTDYYFTRANGKIVVDRVEGQQSDNCAAANKNYTYLPEGHLQAGLKETQTDWKGVITRFEYNARGLETKRTEAEGTPAERVTTTEWHADFSLPTRVIESDNQTVYSYDANGRLLSQTTSPIAP